MNLFGTDGIRNKFGNYPLNENNLIDLAKAICLWAKQKINIPRIIIGSDTRLSSSLIKSLITSGLLHYESKIYDAQIITTPIIYNLVQKQKLFDFGIMITASHNLYQDNGIKIIDGMQDKLDKKDEEQISQIFINKEFNKINYETIGELSYFNDSIQNYINHLAKFFNQEFINNFKIVIDCANGSTSNISKEVFNSFGLNPIIIENKPDGKNINNNCGSTNLKKIQEAVINYKADIGFAFDGDGDRIIVINKYGQIKDGDDILAFLLNNPIYNSEEVVSTIMSNYGLELFLKNLNKKIIRTPVGDKYVAKELVKHNLLIGGEQSGHIILRDYMNSCDGIFVALRILQTIQITQNYNLDTFDRLPQYSINLKVDYKQNLDEEPFISIISKYKKLITGRLIIRYSGTEPLLRIMIEDENYELAKKITQDLYNEFNLILNEMKDSCEKEKNIYCNS